MAFASLSQGRGWWNNLVNDLNYLKITSTSTNTTNSVTALNGWQVTSVVYDTWQTKGHNIYAMHGNFVPPASVGGMDPTSGAVVASFPTNGLAGTHLIMQTVIPQGVNGSGPATLNAYLHPDSGKLDLYNNISGYTVKFKNVDIFLLMIS